MAIFIPNTKEKCEKYNAKSKCTLDNLGYPKIKVEYEKKKQKAKCSVFLAESRTKRVSNLKRK
ncbi:MAG: hypothetical protein K0T53_00955 [Wolbachia pipientis]|nr:hypothetical protein [Wolbachia pipientis]